jgi:hypothetical protein
MIEENMVEIVFKEKNKPTEIMNVLIDNPPLHIFYSVDEKRDCYVTKIIRAKQTGDKA